MEGKMSKILDNVNTPADMKDLDLKELEQLAEEVREMIIDTVSVTGGHLASSLGVVDLTVALLKVFDPPGDRVIWDVSHQAYAYKILTGRKERFKTLRQFGGISGFLKREESAYDAFGAGHAGTALSAGLGMAVARDRRKSDEHVVSILGDGAAGCGVSYEAMNNIADTARKFIVILNDNEMSIAANVGGMSRYLGGLLTSPRYNKWKRSVEGLAARMKMGWMRSAYYRLEEAVKGLFLRSVIFEEFGLRYVGPVNGHNMHSLLDALTIARDSDRPILLHVSTQKGKGYSFAEDHPERWHGVPGFDVKTGEAKAQSSGPSYSQVFGSVMERIAEEDERVVAITAAMPAGTGLSRFAERFPDRFFDVGISEEHAAIFAAGLAAEGMVPVYAVYSTFVQRAVDCIIHDICLQDLPVVICLDRAGVVGDDGPTHHGVFDIALLRPVPGLTIMQPKDEAEFANMLHSAVGMKMPVVIRYPRGAGSGAAVPDHLSHLERGKAEIIRDMPEGIDGHHVWIWGLGDMVAVAEASADLLSKRGISVGVVNARYAKPVDAVLLEKHAARSDLIVTIENGIISGGFGAGVEESLSGRAHRARVVKYGWPDEFIPQGTIPQLKEKYGLTASAIADSILAALGGVASGE
jgi:1-deoxy-D-xylulose-5-phosphate synthase